MPDVLFVCTRNSARSIIAESILRSLGRGRIYPFSAGCDPAPEVSGKVLEFLSERQFPTDGLRPKGLREFASAAALPLAFVITLSAPAAVAVAEQQWSGNPVIARWSLDDSGDGGALADEESSQAIRDAFWVLARRIKVFASLPHGRANRRSLEHKLLALERWQ